jgi:exodeoxyribonuclease V gamma subunit
LPRGAPSLGDAELLARFSSLCGLLFEIQPQARRAHGLKAWAELLEGVATALFAEDDESGQASRMLRGAFAELHELATLSGYESAIPLKTVRRELAGLLLKGTPAVGFLRRGVTFAELVPLRSIPFRVVCLVGMSEDAFPRSDSRPSFDLTREARLPGDRNKRDDDRHAFLQAILCARDRLIITYGAPSGSSRTEANPSPVVWELCETANRYYQQPGGEPVLEATSHPLHAFDSAYFDGGELPQSASERYLQIAQALSERAVERAPVELGAERVGPEQKVSVGELTSWLWNPIESFIDKVLLARFGGFELYEPTSAITKIGGREAAIVGNGALRAGLRGDALAEYLAAAPEFPDGTWGALQRHTLAREIAALNARMDEVQGASETRSELLSVGLGEVVLEGRVDGLGSDQRVLKRFTRPEGKAELTSWIEHLLVEVAGEAGTGRPTRLVLRGDETQASQVSFRVPGDARKLLEDLLAIYQSCQEAPLPLVGPVSRAFAKRFDPEKPLKALGTAKRELAIAIQRSERLAYVFGNDNPLSDEHWAESFQEAALAVYGPLLAHRREP